MQWQRRRLFGRWPPIGRPIGCLPAPASWRATNHPCGRKKLPAGDCRNRLTTAISAVEMVFIQPFQLTLGLGKRPASLPLIQSGEGDQGEPGPHDPAGESGHLARLGLGPGVFAGDGFDAAGGAGRELSGCFRHHYLPARFRRTRRLISPSHR